MDRTYEVTIHVTINDEGEPFDAVWPWLQKELTRDLEEEGYGEPKVLAALEVEK
jgi:hypothetical protein